MVLALTDKQAQDLINLAKVILKKCDINLDTSPVGKILISSKSGKHKFNLYYRYKLNDIHLNFTDDKTKLTLVRINLDTKFHKNADKEIIRGNRVELFSEKEYNQKNDGFTYWKAYKLPYKSFKKTDDFSDALNSLLTYANVVKSNKVNVYFNLIKVL
ncbi:hypothetical protein SAMN04487792_1574 [Lactobacillus bombicola]|uniref:Uncharacterized protein n=1 Tax=Lactobacillus bombicola TaxID=1505723 RepID=A0A1I1TWV5_9LACO|nr:hypothetical protein [Lactobacillus bombicola]SFD60943.1 hypothetical protein SAMN04487792_1574 [Lactobacillus bombicola]